MSTAEAPNSSDVPREKLATLTDNVLRFLEKTGERAYRSTKFLQNGANRIIFLESTLEGADTYEGVRIYSFLVASSPYPSQNFDFMSEVKLDVSNPEFDDARYTIEGDLTPDWVEMIEKALSEQSGLLRVPTRLTSI